MKIGAMTPEAPPKTEPQKTPPQQPPTLPKNVQIEFKTDTDGRTLIYPKGREPFPYKVVFHGDRFPKLLFALFIFYQLLRAISPGTPAAILDLYQDYSGYFWLGLPVAL